MEGPVLSYALIDGDIVAFRAASSAEKNNSRIAVYRCADMMERILRDTGSSHFQVYLSGDQPTFRHDLYPAYKANRLKRPRPQFLEDCREHLAVQWGAQIAQGVEADDLLGIGANTVDPALDPFIATIDKDLQQVPGRHYNFVRDEWSSISPAAAVYNFWWHVLVGDSTDNVPGCPGVGAVKATKYLEGCETDQGMFQVARGLFGSDDELILNATLIWVMREENKKWNPAPYFEREQDTPSSSLLTTSPETALFGVDTKLPKGGSRSPGIATDPGSMLVRPMPSTS